jgi:hypothetical protein
VQVRGEAVQDYPCIVKVLLVVCLDVLPLLIREGLVGIVGKFLEMNRIQAGGHDLERGNAAIHPRPRGQIDVVRPDRRP